MASVLLLGLALVARADPIPPAPSQWVTDSAGFLSSQTASDLNSRLSALQAKTGHQVLVWIGKTTNGQPIEDWAVRAFQAWRIGRKGIDDGLVVFIMAEDRTIRIEVGYGLEGQVPDAIASRIINEEMAPRLRAGDRDGAVTAAVDRIFSALGVSGVGASPPMAEAKPLTPLQIFFAAILILVLIILMIRYPVFGYYVLNMVISALLRGGGGGGGGGQSAGGQGGRSGGGGASGSW